MKMRALSLAFVTIVSLECHALCLEGHPTVAAEAKLARAIVVAKVEAQRDVPCGEEDPKDTCATVYTIRIKNLLQGALGETANIRSENTSARFPMDVGSTYLLFINESSDGLWVNNCGSSGYLPLKNSL